MHKLTALAVFVLAAFLVTACEDAKSNVPVPTSPNVPGNAGTAGTVSVEVTTYRPVAEPDGVRGCRALTIPLDLLVRAGTVDVTVTDITTQFVSSGGVSMAPVTLPAPIPTVQIGSDLIAARSERTIPLVVPLGCTTDPNGTLVVVVGTRDGRGRRNSIEVRARVH